MAGVGSEGISAGTTELEDMTETLMASVEADGLEDVVETSVSFDSDEPEVVAIDELEVAEVSCIVVWYPVTVVPLFA